MGFATGRVWGRLPNYHSLWRGPKRFRALVLFDLPGRWVENTSLRVNHLDPTV